jgi:hypothetical protein
MSDLSLQERLIRYFKARPRVRVAKGALCDLARQSMGVTGESVGRRLRVFHEASQLTMDECAEKGVEHEQAKELLEGGMLEVEYGAKHHCTYYYVSPATRQVREWKLVDGRMKEIIKTVSTI